MDENNESAGTYGEIVRCWAEERETLGIVQPYTAQKAEQKASLFFPRLENRALEEIKPATIRTALIEPRQHGGRFGKGLSSATLRAAHLAGKQAFDWAIERGRRFHDLRHTHATLLISGGTDVKTVQMRLGHSSAEITMSCYAHAIPLSDANAAESIDSSLFG